MIKIAYVVNAYLIAGGAERMLSYKSSFLANNGYDISIIYTYEKPTVEPFFPFDSKIDFYYLGLKNDKDKVGYIEKLAHCLNIIRPDISITLGMGLTKYLYKVNDGSKKIYEFHESKYGKQTVRFSKLDNYFLGRIYSDLYFSEKIAIAKKYDSFVVLTNEDRAAWRGMDDIKVIPNPLTVKTECFSDNVEKKAIAVGRFGSEKRFDEMIRIWSIIHNEFPSWTLSIYGKGHREKKYLKQIAKLGLSGIVEIKEPSQNIQEEMAKHSIFLLTSRNEGFPLVLAESMSCKLPAVAYACKCGPSAIIADGEDGFLIKYDDSRDFVKKLSLLMSNQELRQKMGSAAQKNIQRFDPSYIMPQWTQLFEELIKE